MVTNRRKVDLPEKNSPVCFPKPPLQRAPDGSPAEQTCNDVLWEIVTHILVEFAHLEQVPVITGHWLFW